MHFLPTLRAGIVSVGLFTFLAFFFKPYYSPYFSLDKMPKDFMRRDNWLVKGQGADVLPPPVPIATHLLDSARAKDFTVLGQMKTAGDGYLLATLNEEAWPVRYDTTSHQVLGYYQDLVQLKGITIQYNDQGICLGRR